MGLCPEPSFRRLLGLVRRAGMSFVTDPHTGPLHLRVWDLLEVVFLAAHILRRATTRDLEVLLDMITVQAARVLGITDYGLEVGRATHLVVLEGETVVDVIHPHPVAPAAATV